MDKPVPGRFVIHGMTPALWALEAQERRERAVPWLDGLRAAAENACQTEAR